MAFGKLGSGFSRAGSIGGGGPRISLSSSTVSSAATIGTTVGTLSVLHGTGTYTFTLASNPGGLFAISGSNLNVAAALSAGSDAISINANNGAGSSITQPFLITVTPTGGPVALAMDMSDFRNTYILGL
ncbi:hypothetical protein [Bradyrhizobium erythrophlei]|uniref:hypothetical protein n=1 Tax=Bradyrhizobium erythrophlei TaxID=1437360 RepID=UPI0012ABE3DE|nr:hypothetical protein [Bradyrhizobium erythrophlei]